MPRNDLKAYTTLMARIPQDLADAVKQYASQHRCTVSELIRDGLEMRLEADIPGRSTGHHGEPVDEVLHGVIQVLPEVIHTLSPMLLAQFQAAIRTTVTEVLQGMTEVVPGHTSLPQPHTKGMPSVLPSETPSPASTGEGITEVLQEVMSPTPPTDYEGITAIIQTIAQPAPEVLPGDTSTPQPPAPIIEEGITEVLPIVPQMSEGTTTVIPMVPTILPSATEVIPGHTSTPHAHAPIAEEGITEVVPHDLAANQPTAQVIHEVLPLHADFDHEKFYLGRLCPKGHRYGDSGQSLLRRHNHRCRDCENQAKREKRAARRTAAAREG